jgi:hypothetical protein
MQRKPLQKALRICGPFVIAVCGFCQTPSVKQESKDSTCSNIVALAGNVDIKCSSLTPAQRKIIEGIPAILSKILANQLNTEAVMAKLDEILKAINPNIPSKTYFCDGIWRTSGPSANAAVAISIGGDDHAFQTIIRLQNAGKHKELLEFCLAQIQSTPEWLTPKLFSALAYLALGDSEKAKAMLAEFESKAGDAYDTDGCKQASEYLHEQLH